jgi:signal transduction histidine kinase
MMALNEPSRLAPRKKGASRHLRLRLAFEQGRDAIVLVDRRGHVTLANGRARDLLGPHAQPGAPMVKAFIAPDRARAAELTHTSDERDAILTAHGVEADIVVRVRVARLDIGRTAWTLVPPAAGAERELERALRDTRDLLARERQRCASLERANASMKRLLAMLAHDLRGPLNAVLGWADLLRREPFDRIGRERGLGAIIRNVHAQNALIDELLDVARMSEGKLHVDLAVCDLARIARQTVESAAPSAAAAGLTVRYAGPSGEARVIADGRRMEQVIGNLLSNAIKYSFSGGQIDVVVKCEGERARLDVVDTGRGISASLLPRMFGWLTQDVAHPEDSRGGLGLGLFIVKQLVELQGGSVVAASAGEGKGATFTVHLRSADQGASHEPRAPSLRDDVLRDRRVLVVADDETKRELLAALLRMRGASTVVAAPEDTAALVAHACPHVVVCDLDEHQPEHREVLASVRSAIDGAATIIVADALSTVDCAKHERRLSRPLEARAMATVVAELTARAPREGA